MAPPYALGLAFALISARTASTPSLSIRRSPAVDTRRRTQRFWLSNQKRRSCRLGWKVRIVLLLACDTRWPFMGFLPVTWQTRDIGFSGTAKARILLQQSPLGEGQSVVAGDDEVVEDLHVHERQSLLEVTGEQLIGLARLRGAGRMVMSEDHGGGVGFERRLHN